MYNIVIRLLGNKIDGEDILQESFVAGFKRLLIKITFYCKLSSLFQ
jgi:DNA-directed RNA polymerase specialized sigma24 family protein